MQTMKEIENSLGGRPKVKSKKIRIPIYLKEEEYTKLKDFCSKNSLSMSHFVRLLILKDLGSQD